jgi:hypothetical protein
MAGPPFDPHNGHGSFAVIAIGTLDEIVGPSD